MSKNSYTMQLFLGTALAVLSSCNLNLKKAQDQIREDKNKNTPHVQKTKENKDKLIISLVAGEGERLMNRKSVENLSTHPDETYERNDSLFVSNDIDFTEVKYPYDPDALPSQQCRHAITEIILKHIIKYGPLKTLEILGHGATNVMGHGDQHTPVIMNNMDILQDLIDLQTDLNDQNKLKGSIAEKIILGGCGVFANLTQSDAEKYNNFAKTLHSKISGSTIKVHADHYLKNGITGNYIVFDGSNKLTVDEKLSDVADYLKDLQACQSEASKAYFDDKQTILGESKWAETFHRRHGVKKGILSNITDAM